ncbi:PREDICTED: macrophage receptor MARCO [Hipposideros armiger]|uniref:Macrophage receptor MARCO n=1 Tax=Hipposideros armiger TaxID=186990 RepID=A0A8B7QAY4_HIPAR|nr:PREDICTED: macrophage receptor MARCO [Hipposideros armiger]
MGPPGAKGSQGDSGKPGPPELELDIHNPEFLISSRVPGCNSEWKLSDNLEWRVFEAFQVCQAPQVPRVSLAAAPGGQGATGIPGLKGEKGSKGDGGLIGPKGETGAKGDKGDLGLPVLLPSPFFCILILGLQGQKGTKGESGVPGPAGMKGERGSPGLAGPKGVPGPVGQKGHPGEKGSSGVQGVKGEKGEKGASLAPVRIVGSLNRGRAEIYYNGKWGTICDDDWDNADATVFCRMMGYSVGKALFNVGAGSGDIWLDNVACRGTELTLWNCNKNSWGSHNCNHNEDAGVDCS